MLLDVNQILGPEGLIARRLKNYEVRQQQLQLAGAIYHSLQHGGHLIAEAGTGIGKSFAYLVPAILHATSDQKEKPTSTTSDDDQDQDAKVRRVVISTHTISLQEQLIHKDLPLLNSVIPREFSSVLVKGRSNYLSRRRYELAGTRAVSLLDEGDQSQLRQIKQWIAQTNDGSLSSLPFRPSPSLWDELASDTSNCMGRKCKTYDSCFYYLARRRIFNAQILVVNHALFFTDLVLRESAGFGLLPPYSAVILDECHTIESVASEHLGIRVTSGQLRYTLNKLFNPMTGKGLFAAMDLHRMCEAVTKAHLMVDQFIFDVDQWLGSSVRETTRVTTQKIVSDSLSDHFLSIAGKLNHLADQSPNAPTYKDISSAAERLTSLATNLRSWLNQSVKELVYWGQR
ncbi:MAG TPA: helicase, partial [Planctomycetaceae bacterium]|nr:helicase [Planctomycetaceae bacterium]